MKYILPLTLFFALALPTTALAQTKIPLEKLDKNPALYAGQRIEVRVKFKSILDSEIQVYDTKIKFYVLRRDLKNQAYSELTDKDNVEFQGYLNRKNLTQFIVTKFTEAKSDTQWLLDELALANQNRDYKRLKKLGIWAVKVGKKHNNPNLLSQAKNTFLAYLKVKEELSREGEEVLQTYQEKLNHALEYNTLAGENEKSLTRIRALMNEFPEKQGSLKKLLHSSGKLNALQTSYPVFPKRSKSLRGIYIKIKRTIQQKVKSAHSGYIRLDPAYAEIYLHLKEGEKGLTKKEEQALYKVMRDNRYKLKFKNFPIHREMTHERKPQVVHERFKTTALKKKKMGSAKVLYSFGPPHKKGWLLYNKFNQARGYLNYEGRWLSFDRILFKDFVNTYSLKAGIDSAMFCDFTAISPPGRVAAGTASNISRGNVTRGMTKDDVLSSWRFPEKTYTFVNQQTSTTVEMWVYIRREVSYYKVGRKVVARPQKNVKHYVFFEDNAVIKLFEKDTLPWK